MRKVTSAEVYEYMTEEEILGNKKYNTDLFHKKPPSSESRQSAVKFMRVRKRLRRGQPTEGPTRSRLEQRQRQMLSQKRNSGRKQGLEVTLAFEDMVWPTNCPCCGSILDYFQCQTRHGAQFDRIISSDHYTLQNTQILCFRCNKHKADMTPEEAKRLADFMN